jgi:hypothetical protein
LRERERERKSSTHAKPRTETRLLVSRHFRPQAVVRHSRPISRIKSARRLATNSPAEPPPRDNGRYLRAESTIVPLAEEALIPGSCILAIVVCAAPFRGRLAPSRPRSSAPQAHSVWPGRRSELVKCILCGQGGVLRASNAFCVARPALAYRRAVVLSDV